MLRRSELNIDLSVKNENKNFAKNIKIWLYKLENLSSCIFFVNPKGVEIALVVCI